MNISVLRVDALSRPAPVWTPAQAFEPTMTLARGLQRAVSYVIGPATFLSEDKDRAFERQCMALVSPLVEKIQAFSSPVMNGADVVAAAASLLVRQEAVRLAVEFVRVGLEASHDQDEVVMPSVHQAQSGAIQFEWHRKGIDLEIALVPSGEIVGYLEREGREPKELDLAAGVAAITQELRTVLRR